MRVRFVCLANSYKEGGRCLAGIELDDNNNAIKKHGQPKWIRPVCNTPHGEVPNQIAEPFSILDILELEVKEYRPENYQSENALFNKASIRKIGVFDKRNLEELCEHKKYIFSTRYDSLSEEVVQELYHSLMLIKPETFEVISKVHQERPDKLQHRLSFFYNGVQYDFSITDPVFLQRYQQNHKCMEGIEQVFLCLSVGLKFSMTNRYYKLVAAIIY